MIIMYNELNIHLTTMRFNRLNCRFWELGGTSSWPHIWLLHSSETSKPDSCGNSWNAKLKNTCTTGPGEAHLCAPLPHQGLDLTVVHYWKQLEWANAHFEGSGLLGEASSRQRNPGFHCTKQMADTMKRSRGPLLCISSSAITLCCVIMHNLILRGSPTPRPAF